jgi:hypothetical protein
MTWNEEDDMFKRLTATLGKITERDLRVLRAIRNELTGTCKHPKKMHDICKGQKYCMACNMDL